MNSARKPIRKALTFRASSIGDALNAKYLFENIHAAYPDARCCLVIAGRGGMIRDLLAAYPWIEVREVNRKDPRSVWKLLKDFHGSDLVVAPYTKPSGRFSFPSKLIGRLLAWRGTYVGFGDAPAWSRYMYDRTLFADPDRAPRRLEQDALRAAGVPVSIEDMRLLYPPQPSLLFDLGLERKAYIVVHLFAGSENRGLSEWKRQELLDALANALPNAPLILTGSAAERPHLERLTLPAAARVVAGDLSIAQLCELIAGSSCMVSIGTGPSHIASHLHAQLVVLVTCVGIPWVGKEQYGDAAPIRIFSDVAACAGIHDFVRQYPACIEDIDAKEVARAAQTYFLAVSLDNDP